MATQSAGTSPKTKRLGIFPRSFRKFIFAFVIILFLVAGAVWIWQVWGTTSNVLGVIFTVAGVIVSVLTLWPSSEPTEAGTPASSSLVQLSPQALDPIKNYNNAEQRADPQYFPEQVSSNPNKNASESHSSILKADETNAREIVSSAPSFTAPPPPHVYTTKPPQALPFTSINATPSKLTGQESFDLTNALLDAYPEREDFEIMLKAKLNKRLNTLVDGSHNYSNLLFKLIELTEAEGWTNDLVLAAHEWRPRNTVLQSWQQKYAARQIISSVNTIGSELQQTSQTSHGIAESLQEGQIMAVYQEQPNPQKTNASPDQQLLEQARKSIGEAHEVVQRSKVIFEGKGGIQQKYYLQATTALRQVASCVQHLQNLLQTITPVPAYLDRERLIIELRYISTEINDSITHITNYDTLNAHQQERNRKDTEMRLSGALTQLEDLDRRIMNKGPL